MDRKLQTYLPQRGVFVEAGANDGYRQSNTYYLERCRGWTGVLVEPVPDLAKQAARDRRSLVVNAGLVGNDYCRPTIVVEAGGLTSIVADIKPAGHRAEAGSHRLLVDVPARTLSSILDEHLVAHVDFLSLDVEGYEPRVLTGLDFGRHAPTWILVEIQGRRDGVEAILGGQYELVTSLSHHDYLYERVR
jgi:FkbM family methyltransferase